MRSPTNKAEALSRIGAFLYFQSYIPELAALTTNIRNMCNATTDFVWDDQLELKFKAIKMLIELRIKNNTVDPTNTLYLSCDASQIAISFTLFQIDNQGCMQIIATSGRLLNEASRNQSTAMREAFSIQKWSKYSNASNLRMLLPSRPSLNRNFTVQHWWKSRFIHLPS